MTIEQRMQWVACPRGASEEGTTLELSVIVSPRLRTDEAVTLAPFLDLRDWPATVAATTFALELGDHTLVPATVVSPPPETSLWTALFSADTPLTPFVFDDFADRPIVSYSVPDMVGLLRQLYTAVAAASPSELLPVVARAGQETRALADLARDWVAVRDGELLGHARDGEQLDEQITAYLATARAHAAARRAPGAARAAALIEPLAGGSTARQLERLLLFHRRPGAAVEIPEGETARAHYTATIDFHQMIGALGDHPALARRLGLIVDLTVDPADVPDATGLAPARLRVRPTWASSLPPGASTDIVPWTSYARMNVDGETFFAAAPLHPDPALPAGPPIGLLPLPGTTFSLNQVDVDGAALKLLQQTATLATAAAAPAARPFDAPETAGLPSLRVGGLSLVESGRATALAAQFGDAYGHNAAVEAGADFVLHGEDLVRGYRLDVLDGRDGVWRSLHERTVTYRAERYPHPIDPVTDEGFFALSLAGPATPPGADPDPTAEIYVHESLVTWTGWSLAAPRPGKAISRTAAAPTPGRPETEPQRVTNDSLTALGLGIDSVAVPGTLPRLRFGHAYRVRVRTVDLCGNGPTLADANRHLLAPGTVTPALPAAGTVPYLRFEPLAAPALVPREPFTEGASLARLVVRSSAELGPDDYAAQFNASEDGVGAGHLPYAGADERHIAAPKTSVELVELHGWFDSEFGSDGTPPDEARRAALQAAYALARKEKGSLDDPTLPGVETVEIAAAPLLPPTGAFPAPPQRYVVHHEPLLDLPYLPDPLAGGAGFIGLPGTAPGELFRVDYSRPDQHARIPFRLRLVGGAGPPFYDDATRVLTVAMPPATTAPVRIVSLFDGDFAQMGVLNWCEGTLTGDELDRVIEAVKSNRSWLVTPWHDLTLVHAVQRPLENPAVLEFTASRNSGDTFVDLFGIVEVSVASTDKIDVVATWTERIDDPQYFPQVDDPHDLRWTERACGATVFELPLRVARTGRVDQGPHDVPYSLIDGRLVSFSTSVGRSLPVPAPTAQVLGDTRYRRIGYRVVATTPFREYFPQAWSAHSEQSGAAPPELLTVTSDVITLDVPSSAPPLAPHVQYVVPTFGRDASPETILGDGPVVRQRRGGGLRVYLSRPWFSSGEGEQVGLLVGPSQVSPLADEYPYMTLLGQDPARASSPLEVATADNFRNAAADPVRLPLRELGSNITIIPFDPCYDETDPGRWFVDIDMDTHGAYFPFVRLALVRYQSHSLPGCHLSPVILCDIVQTVPDRTLTVTAEPEDRSRLTVTVAGPSYTATAGPVAARADAAALGRVRARVEQQTGLGADNELGWRTVDGGAVELTRVTTAETTTWSGQLTVPSDLGMPCRLSVEESDALVADAATADSDGLATRIIYADVIAL